MDRAGDCLSRDQMTSHAVTEIYTILTITVQMGLGSAELKFWEGIRYLFASKNERSSQVSQKSIPLTCCDSRMNPVQLSDIPFLKERTMEYEILGFLENKYEEDAHTQSIGMMS